MSIYSMTGYAVTTRESSMGPITIELKSVNSRFLDLQFRVNDDLRAFEPLLREAIIGRIARGKVECRLSFGRKASADASQKLNIETLQTLRSLEQQVLTLFPQATQMSTNELLRWPGVIEEAQAGQDTLQAEITATLNETLDAFVLTREREGASLKDVIFARIDAMEDIVRRVTPMVPEVIAQFKQKAIDRLQEALGIATADGITTTPSREDMMERIRQEVTLYGIRIDIAEEIARLSTHLTETRHILKKGGQVGKRLDFMMQELNREANTLGSKAAIKELADASMELKILIDQIREQIQNLE
jgi:uncharacterized protein (TIGR00255 family)